MTEKFKKGLTMAQLSLGQKYTKTITVTEEMISLFGQATGDMNPIHHDKAAGRASIFGRRVAHGMLTAGTIGGIFGTEFPGIGTIYLSHDLMFTKPVFIGDSLTYDLEVIGLDEKRNRAQFQTLVVNQEDKAVLKGTAWVMPPAA